MASIVRVPVNAGIGATGRWVLRWLEFPAALAVVVTLWQLASTAIANKTLLPSPFQVLQAWISLLHGDLREDVLASLFHLGVGYGLGASTGLALAIVSTRFVAVESIVDPGKGPVAFTSRFESAEHFFGTCNRGQGQACKLRNMDAVGPVCRA